MALPRRTMVELSSIVAVFLLLCFVPFGRLPLWAPLSEALALAGWYAREHVVMMLVPACFLAGGISVFLGKGSVLRLLGPGAVRWKAYTVASVAGCVLAVCSCTVLPLFAGIYRLGAGVGPACTFLYSGPAINALALILTGRVLGLRMGLSRALGAVVFSVAVGVLMALLVPRRAEEAPAMVPVSEDHGGRRLWQVLLVLAAIMGVILFANWARSGDVKAFFLCCPEGGNVFHYEGRIISRDADEVVLQTPSGRRRSIPATQFRGVKHVTGNVVIDGLYVVRWGVVAACLLCLAWMIRRWFDAGERREWVAASWSFARQILPLLLLGVLAAGFLFGRPGYEGLLPSRWVSMLVGSDPELFVEAAGLGPGVAGLVRGVWPLLTNLVASVAGALMYFATLTEIPILQGLMGSGMDGGPALALLLAGPALSLPNMLVIRSVMGTRRTAVFVVLVVLMATVSGMAYGWLFAAGQ